MFSVMRMYIVFLRLGYSIFYGILNNCSFVPLCVSRGEEQIHGLKENVEGTPCGPLRSSALPAAETGESSGLHAALDRKAIDKTRREAVRDNREPPLNKQTGGLKHDGGGLSHPEFQL